MLKLIDVVNFNPDASCLPAAEWLAILEGGAQSRLCRWLDLYVRMQRRVVLGFVGGAVADMAQLNPEAVALVNAHPDVFEVIVRPFAHDVGLLRSARGFKYNFQLGRDVICREFANVVEYFLPPEFMLTSAQVKLLADARVGGVFINPARFKDEIQQRLPAVPYLLDGVLDARLPCIPFHGRLTEAYLDALHAFDAAPWLGATESLPASRAFVWRDGESCFLIPEGLEREAAWLAGEQRDSRVERECLRDAIDGLEFLSREQLPDSAFRAYPVHSFTAWFKEFRMLGYLNRLERIEQRLADIPPDAGVVWLQAINSDVLSAVEKESPVVTLHGRDRLPDAARRFTILRSERGFEGEDYLALLEHLLEGSADLRAIEASSQPHLVKLRARIGYVRSHPSAGVQ